MAHAAPFFAFAFIFTFFFDLGTSKYSELAVGSSSSDVALESAISDSEVSSPLNSSMVSAALSTIGLALGEDERLTLRLATDLLAPPHWQHPNLVGLQKYGFGRWDGQYV